MLTILLSCLHTSPKCSQPLTDDASMIDIFVRLENDRCVHPNDIDTLNQRMKEYHTQTTLHCDQVYRRSSADGLLFNGKEELVLNAASVADVVIDKEGQHIIAYNDTSTDTLVNALSKNPEAFWERGLIGFGGLGLAIDSMNGTPITYLQPNLHLNEPLELVDPDIGITADGQYRISFFAVQPTKMNRTQHGPMAAEKPHHFYRTASANLTDFPAPEIIVSSSEGSNGGADPAILTRNDGSEILFVGPLDHTTMGWVSQEGDTWTTTSPPTFDTKQRFATPDAVPDPNGGYRLYGMTNGRPGTFEVALSDDGIHYSKSRVVLQEHGAFNISVGVDPANTWWAYYNKTDMSCVKKWGANKILPPSFAPNGHPSNPPL